MNRISINLKYGDSVQFKDSDDLPHDQVADKLSSLFSINSVAILKTNKTSVIIRPSDIGSIQVESLEYDDTIEEVPIPTPKIKIEPKEEVIDIITDID